jgi:hypothetical protein
VQTILLKKKIFSNASICLKKIFFFTFENSIPFELLVFHNAAVLCFPHKKKCFNSNLQLKNKLPKRLIRTPSFHLAVVLLKNQLILLPYWFSSSSIICVESFIFILLFFFVYFIFILCRVCLCAEWKIRGRKKQFTFDCFALLVFEES